MLAPGETHLHVLSAVCFSNLATLLPAQPLQFNVVLEAVQTQPRLLLTARRLAVRVAVSSHC
jgi:hypothetical protein